MSEDPWRSAIRFIAAKRSEKSQKAAVFIRGGGDGPS
jgi:hypothetical protein